MKNIRFWLGLWAGKFAAWIYKMRGYEENDRPGTLTRHFDKDFIKHASKPRIMTVVTGTNGKTSMNNMIAEMFEIHGESVISNRKGNNSLAGETWLFIKLNSIFNKPKKDIAVLEADEMFSEITFPQIEPDYILITNIGRDSMFRNASPDFIQGKITKGIDACTKATLILNGDDPLSCFFGEGKKRVYYGVADIHAPKVHYQVEEFSVCPVCGFKPAYKYHNLRHIGEFYCPHCSLKAPDKDYLCVRFDSEKLFVREPDGIEREYPVIAQGIHNIYNAVSLVAYFRTIGWSYEDTYRCMSEVELPKERYMYSKVGDIELFMFTAKSQNFMAASLMYENDSFDDTDKELLIITDEEFGPDQEGVVETSTWIYDVQYEFLNKENIKKIVVGGNMFLDHKLRLLMAGIPESKIIAVRTYQEAAELLDVEGVKKIMIYRDMENIKLTEDIFYRVEERLKERWH